MLVDQMTQTFASQSRGKESRRVGAVLAVLYLRYRLYLRIIFIRHDVVIRARQGCEARAATPAPVDGPVVDRASSPSWGAVAEQPGGVSLWPPAVFDAADSLFVRNGWQAHMFRKTRDGNGQSSSKAQMREGQLAANAMLWGEMGMTHSQIGSVRG